MYYLKNDTQSKEAALKCFTEAIKHAKGDLADKSLYYQACAYVELDRKKEAIAAYKKLLQKYPDSRYSDLATEEMNEIK